MSFKLKGEKRWWRMTLLFWRDWEGCAVYLKMETKNRMTIYLILLILHSCFMSKRSLYFILEHQTNLPQPIYSCISPIVHQSNFTCLYLRKSFIITLIDFLSENMYVIILSATFLMGGFRATRCMLHKTRWLQKMICSSIKISLILFGMFYYSWMNQRTFVSAVCLFFFFLAGHHRDKRETWFWVIFFMWIWDVHLLLWLNQSRTQSRKLSITFCSMTGLKVSQGLGHSVPHATTERKKKAFWTSFSVKSIFSQIWLVIPYMQF